MKPGNCIHYALGMILVLCIVLLAGCAKATEPEATQPTTAPPSASVQNIGPASVDLYRGMQKDKGALLCTFTKPEDTQVFQDAMLHAEKLPGLVDIRAADFSAMVHYENQTESILLWVEPGSASLMYEDDAGTLYRIPQADADRLRTLLAGFMPKDGTNGANGG